MPILQTHEQMYDFVQLPAYASFLLHHHIDAYTQESIRLSYEVDLPLLKHLKHLDEVALFELSKASAIKYLTYLSRNKAKEQIEESLDQWLTNQLPMIGKYDIDAKDITIINYVRAKVLKKWMKEYIPDINTILELNAEIDELKLGQNTTFANAYIQILKERIEEELHFSRNVINASPGITYIFDLTEQKITYINGKVEEVMGYTLQDVLGKHSNLIADFAHAEDHAVLMHFIKEVIEDRVGQTYQAEFRFRDKQGAYRWFRSYAVVYKRDNAGTPIQLLGSGFEITNEKDVSRALVKRERQLLEAQAIAQIGSYEWDIVNDTSVSTPELRNIFAADKRQSLEEMMAKVHPQDKQMVHDALEESFSSGSYTCEYRYIANGGEKVIDSKGVVTFDTNSKPVLMTGTVQDVTERKRIEETLIKKTQELERSNVQLQEFASIVSHDLKEPLRKITMFSDVIVSTENERLSEKAKSNLQKITDAAQRMTQLIEGILSYSSFGTEVQKQTCSLEELLRLVLETLESRVKESNALVTSDGLPQAVVIPVQIQQLFQNLISNALKFSKKGVPPQIRITHAIVSSKEVQEMNLQPANHYLQIHVWDNGIGFNKEAAEKIFGLFQRLHGKSAYEGSGLGLAICRKIAENHGGSIIATSEPNVGSTFTVLLPI
jgi:PAS domain S-box-containing protein